MKHNTEFVPSPKMPKKTKSKKRGKSGLKVELVEPIEGTAGVPMDVDEEVKSNSGKRKKGVRFGSEATNRPEDKRVEDAESPLKRQRVNYGSGDEDLAPALGKMSRGCGVGS